MNLLTCGVLSCLIRFLHSLREWVLLPFESLLCLFFEVAQAWAVGCVTPSASSWESASPVPPSGKRSVLRQRSCCLVPVGGPSAGAGFQMWDRCSHRHFCSCFPSPHSGKLEPWSGSQEPHLPAWLGARPRRGSPRPAFPAALGPACPGAQSPCCRLLSGGLSMDWMFGPLKIRVLPP